MPHGIDMGHSQIRTRSRCSRDRRRSYKALMKVMHNPSSQWMFQLLKETGSSNLCSMLCGLFLSLVLPREITAQRISDPLDHKVIALEEGQYCDQRSWRLVFEDEFDGDSLDTDTWIRFYPYCMNQDECRVSRTHGWPGNSVVLRRKRSTLREWHAKTDRAKRPPARLVRSILGLQFRDRSIHVFNSERAGLRAG